MRPGGSGLGTRRFLDADKAHPLGGVDEDINPRATVSQIHQTKQFTNPVASPGDDGSDHDPVLAKMIYSAC